MSSACDHGRVDPAGPPERALPRLLRRLPELDHLPALAVRQRGPVHPRHLVRRHPRRRDELARLLVVAVRQLVRRPRRDDAPLDHEERLVRDAERARHVVRDHHARHLEARPRLLDQIVDHPARQRIEPAGRLVVDEDLGLQHQRARQAHALALPAGQLRRHPVLLVLEAERVQHAHDLVADVPLRHVLPVLAQRERHVVEDRQRVEQRRVLEHHAEPLAHPVHLEIIERAHVHAVDPDVTGGRPLQPDEQPEQRGLASARPADDHRRLGPPEVHGDAVQHLRRPERFLDVVDEEVIPRLPPRRHVAHLLRLRGGRTRGGDLAGRPSRHPRSTVPRRRPPRTPIALHHGKGEHVLDAAGRGTETLLMTDDLLKAALETAEAKTDKDGWAELPEGRVLTIYAAHDGVSLPVTKIEAVSSAGGLLKARSTKGETFVLALKDVFAIALDGGGKGAQARKAGFLG
ncbi:hypothetical protein predicted by Glimmer/Critica [Sorangium cellulosum So ce56]|uniref:Uncharacterized protein n=2 Tax=Polyangiaceae TaxID=49 RepID=A9GIQ0_SORC5|nr:hypothetical protein predicted by Glimmer/Critica [Sorangium cellulosum So ce56]